MLEDFANHLSGGKSIPRPGQSSPRQARRQLPRRTSDPRTRSARDRRRRRTGRHHPDLRGAEARGRAGARAGGGQPRAAPPVCRIMDFGKFKYETSKKEKASRKHQSTVVVKEIKLRPEDRRPRPRLQGEAHSPFLGEGNKCKLVIVFRGRENRPPRDRAGDARQGASSRWATRRWSSSGP